MICATNSFSHPFPVPKTKPWKSGKPIMTLIAGAVCRDGVLLACDSQTTSGDTKSLETIKITIVQFGDLPVLIGEAGFADFSGEAIRIFQNKALDFVTATRDDIERAATMAVRQVVNDQHEMCKYLSAEEWDRYRTANMDFELLFAYWYDGKYRIFKIRPRSCIVCPAKLYFETAGSGGNLAGLLINEYMKEGMTTDFASLLMAYVIEKVKKYDHYCGGLTRLAAIQLVPDSPFPGEDQGKPMARFLPEEEIASLCRIAAEVENETKPERDRQLLTKLREKQLKELSEGLSAHWSEDPNLKLIPPSELKNLLPPDENQET